MQRERRVERDNREGEDEEHPVKVVSVNSRVMWQRLSVKSAHLSVSMTGGGGRAETEGHNAVLSSGRVMDFLH